MDVLVTNQTSNTVNVIWGSGTVKPFVHINSQQQGAIVGVNGAPVQVYGSAANVTQNNITVRALDPFMPAGKALEMGCYKGEVTEMLAARYADLTVIEASGDLVAASELAAPRIPNLPVARVPHQPYRMDFGPRWSNVKRIDLGQGEALLSLELPEAFASDLDTYRLHPALMDMATGAAQAIVLLVIVSMLMVGYGRAIGKSAR